MSLSALFFARCADLYLTDTGRIGMVMPRAVLTTEQHSRFTSFSFKGSSQVLKLEKVLDLEQVSPLFNVPACVLVARNGQLNALRQAGPELVEVTQDEWGDVSVRGEPVEPPVAQGTTYPVPGIVFSGDVPSRNASWLEAEPMLERDEITFDRQAGKVLPEG
jgi:hypothetical protein